MRFILLLIIPAVSNAQDPHFSSVQDMNTWYNPALKTNQMPQAYINFRNVNYQGAVVYSSKAASIDLPLVSNTAMPGEIRPFANITVGINTDNATDGSMKLSTGMLSFSYALPLNGDDTYLAAGFQGVYNFSRVGFDGNLVYPLQFDKYGAIGTALIADPLQSGYQFGYFAAGAGAALFHDGEKKQWYLGASVRHFNQPVSEWTHNYHVPRTIGIQAGYTTVVSNTGVISGYGVFSWQAGVEEQLLGCSYKHYLDDSANYAIAFTAACRLRDAAIPGIGLYFGKSRLSFSYEFNIFGTARYYRRNTFEFAYLLKL